MDNNLPPTEPKVPTAPAQDTPPTTNPYETEIAPDQIEKETSHQPSPAPQQTNNPYTTPQYEAPKENDEKPDYPHRPHHFATKKAVVLGVLFLLTAALSSIVTFALVNSREKMPVADQKKMTVAPSPTPDPTAGWQAYTDTMGTYSIKYPLDYQIYNSAENTTIIGTQDQIDLYKQTEITPNSTNKPSTIGIQVLPPQTYTPDPSAVVENVKLAGKDFSKITTAGETGEALVEYTYSDSQHLYRLAYVKGVNESNFEKIISTFMLTTIPAVTTAPEAGTGACTLEAKICSDGSSVGRVPPSCEFAACP